MELLAYRSFSPISRKPALQTEGEGFERGDHFHGRWSDESYSIENVGSLALELMQTKSVDISAATTLILALFFSGSCRTVKLHRLNI